ncbi:hypothetical protein [Photobacterium sanguinicancri]|uniref:Lysozyme inhibitor LprI N-terminal domain-containing protein n=1 Tax=Photobacterium sanguinicancri TaxID=875932 RepID=A0ABX4FZV0_9GAMM|nr:hypothetical protein [Photobacterium sanguinicancri]MDO6498904.1 hypothetical protein [Photobacterium sanguinicancri]OZS44426.1 hypothetical protein ASV53_08055 [Photobacterium sanguinicancri]
MKSMLLPLLSCLAACSSQQSANQPLNVSQYVEQTCYTSASDELSSSFDTFLDHRKDELAGLRSELTDENFQQLHFALSHFSTYWEKLEIERNQACEQWAACQFITESSHAASSMQPSPHCEAPNFEYNVSRVKMVTFLSDVANLQLQRSGE